jgi:hypothetical protein
MLIKNIDETLVNGSVGRVLSFQTVDGYQAYKRSLLVNGTSETADVDEKAKEKPAAGKNEVGRGSIRSCRRSSVWKHRMGRFRLRGRRSRSSWLGP